MGWWGACCGLWVGKLSSGVGVGGERAMGFRREVERRGAETFIHDSLSLSLIWSGPVESDGLARNH